MSNTAVPKFLGRYEIVRELGKGAMGVVYEGRDPNIGRRVAIKTMRKDVMESSGRAEEMLERFLREAQAAGLLNHPNIITIYDAGEEGNTAYIAMEFVEGFSLRSMLDERKMLDTEEIVEMGATICDALAAAHDQGVVHRDVKPDNILLPTNGALKVADFGIARVSNSNLTQDGELIGTPFYMSPEQFTGQKLDGRSDLFSVAVILYEMVTGEKPFMGEALTAMMHNVINTTPIPPQKLNFNIPNPLGDVIMKGLSKRPADRYADGRSMAKALRECMKPNPNPAVLGLAPSASSTVMSGSGFGGGATHVGGAQSSGMHATLPGAPPASILMNELLQNESGPRTPSPVQAVPEKKKASMMPLIAGGVVLLAVIAGGAFFALGGAKDNAANTDTSNNTPTANTNAEGQKVLFTVYGIAGMDSEAYEAFNDIKTDENAPAAWEAWEKTYVKDRTVDIKLLDAKVVFKNKKTGIPSKPFDTGKPVPIPDNLAEYFIDISAEGYEESPDNIVRLEGEIPNLCFLLIKETTP